MTPTPAAQRRPCENAAQRERSFASGRAHLLLDRLVRRRDDIGHDNLLSLAAAALAEGADGVAAGAGLGIALASDIRLASEGARFTSVFVKRSLVPDAGVSEILIALAGPGIAAEMSYTGRVYDARWALSKGLVNDVIPDDELMPQAEALANEIAANPPLAVKAIQGLFNVHHTSLNKVILAEHRANDPLRGTNDQKEAVQAFLEKRSPKFTGT